MSGYLNRVYHRAMTFEDTQSGKRTVDVDTDRQGGGIEDDE